MEKKQHIDEAQKDLNLDIADLEELLKNYANKDVYREFLNRLFIVIIAGLGLISALAWDQVLREFFFQWIQRDTLGARLGYALLITFITALFSVLLGRIVKSQHKK